MHNGNRGKLIGIYAPLPGSGKSTLAEAIVRKGKATRVISLAEPLKEMLVVLLVHNGYTAQEAWHLITHCKHQSLQCLGGKTIRYALQTLGTEWGRNFIDEDVWVIPWEKKVERMLEAGCDVVCDDVRRDNEMQAVRDEGGMVVVLRRPALPVPECANHASEGQLEDEEFDEVILAEEVRPADLDAYMDARAETLLL